MLPDIPLTTGFKGDVPAHPVEVIWIEKGATAAASEIERIEYAEWMHKNNENAVYWLTGVRLDDLQPAYGGAANIAGEARAQFYLILSRKLRSIRILKSSIQGQREDLTHFLNTSLNDIAADPSGQRHEVFKGDSVSVFDIFRQLPAGFEQTLGEGGTTRKSFSDAIKSAKLLLIGGGILYALILFTPSIKAFQRGKK